MTLSTVQRATTYCWAGWIKTTWWAVPGNDTLMGGDGFDFLEGGLGADVLRGDAAMDGFGYRIDVPGDLAFLGGDTIHGFQTGVDKIELVDLIWDFGIDPSEAVSGGYVVLTKAGDDTLVQFDKDGIRRRRPAYAGDRRGRDGRDD